MGLFGGCGICAPYRFASPNPTARVLTASLLPDLPPHRTEMAQDAGEHGLPLQVGPLTSIHHPNRLPRDFCLLRKARTLDGVQILTSRFRRSLSCSRPRRPGNTPGRWPILEQLNTDPGAIGPIWAKTTRRELELPRYQAP